MRLGQVLRELNDLGARYGDRSESARGSSVPFTGAWPTSGETHRVRLPNLNECNIKGMV